MKFFIPAAKDDLEAESVLRKIAQFVGFGIPEPRIYSLTYWHNGKAMTATVGENPDSYYQEVGPVIAILQREDCLAVCLPHRGVLRGEPIYVGDAPTNKVEFFESTS